MTLNSTPATSNRRWNSRERTSLSFPSEQRFTERGDLSRSEKTALRGASLCDGCSVSPLAGVRSSCDSTYGTVWSVLPHSASEQPEIFLGSTDEHRLARESSYSPGMGASPFPPLSFSDISLKFLNSPTLLPQSSTRRGCAMHWEIREMVNHEKQ